MQPTATRPTTTAHIRVRHTSVHIRLWVRALAAVTTVALAVPLLLVVALPVNPAHAAVAGESAATTVSTTVSFVGAGGVVLHGTVVAPESPTAQRRPGMVMIAGAGNRGRQELLPAAQAFARHGIVTLVYDKRTVGYSLFHRDYSVLATDALAAVRLLRLRADVDPATLGLWALSEGAFVAPLAANRSTDVKFLITVGAVGVTPAEQTAWAYGEFLRHAGVAGSLPHTLQVTAVRAVVAAGLFAEADFDPVPAWEHVRQPVLAQWGVLDRQAVPQQSSQIIGQALRRGGNTHYLMRFVAGARHDLNLTTDGGFDRAGDLSSDYGDFEAVWISGLARHPGTGDLSPASTRTAVPSEDQPSQPITPLAWYESPWLQAAVLLLFLVAFAGYPLTALARRLRGRDSAPRVARPARWLAATGLATTVGLVGYLFFMLATAANVVGVVLLGRPLPWLILQILAVTTVAATIATAVQWGRHAHDVDRVSQLRLGLLLAAGFVFVPWAAYWGLLAP